MRTLGLDVHKRFAEVAILEGKDPPTRQRIGTTSSALRAFAHTLRPDDQLVLEATMNTWAIRDLLCESAARADSGESDRSFRTNPISQSGVFVTPFGGAAGTTATRVMRPPASGR